MKVVGITSCPSGVAHTYMAAEALKLSGEKLGMEVIIETQGGAGVENQLKQKDIDVWSLSMMWPWRDWTGSRERRS